MKPVIVVQFLVDPLFAITFRSLCSLGVSVGRNLAML